MRAVCIILEYIGLESCVFVYQSTRLTEQCYQATTKTTSTKVYKTHKQAEQVIAPTGVRRYVPADGSSTHGGSTSARGRVRSPHIAKLQLSS